MNAKKRKFSSPDELLACRICLVTDCKLYSLREESLKSIYSKFVSSNMDTVDGLPQHICSYCRDLLMKATTFRNKCVAAVNYLRRHLSYQSITTDYLRNIDKADFEHSYKISPIVNVDLPESDLNIAEDEIDLGPEIENNADEKSNENDFENNDVEDLYEDVDYLYAEDLNIFSDDVIVDENNKFDDIIIEMNDTASEGNDNDSLDNSSQNLNIYIDHDYVNTNGNVGNDENKEIDKDRHEVNKCFYTFILKKYVVKSLEFKNVINIVDDEDLVEVKGKYQFAIKDAPDIDEIDTAQRERFHKYIGAVYRHEEKRSSYMVPKIPSYRVPSNFKLVEFETIYVKRLEDAAKQYNFSLQTFSFEEQKQEMIKHTAKYQYSRYKCEFCLRGFQVESRYKNHVKLIHDPSVGPESCPVCGKRCRDSRRLFLHSLRHKYQLACNECGQMFPETSSVRVHYNAHEGCTFPCEHCGKLFSKYKTRIEHVRIHHSTVQCAVCYKRLSSANAVTLHHRLMHNTTFPCDECKTVFATEDALRAHVADAATARCSDLVPCALCGKNFDSKSKREIHVESAHESVINEQRCYEYRSCCPCKCINKTEIDNSININPTDENKPNLDDKTQNKPTLNPIDLLAGNNENNPNDTNINTSERRDTDTIEDGAADAVTSNRRTVRRGKRRICKCDCVSRLGKNERRRWELRLRKNLMCEFCGQNKFQTECHLKAHQRLHSGEKPFPCELCDKRFRTKHNLQLHLPTHTGERNYPCSTCGKKFKNASAVYRHNTTVHLKLRPHQCHICGNTQLTSTGLKMHIRTVHLKMPYPPRRRRTRKKKIKHTGEL